MVKQMTIWCSDIDGVLVDSRELVRESYAAVGVEMPVQAWGHPWQTWLPNALGSLEKARELHAEKTKKYVETLKNGAAIKHKLPFADIARALERDPACLVYYVTGAANDTALTILTELGLNHKNLVGHGVSTTEREAVFRKLGSRGVYIDDRIEGQAPAHAAGWDFIWAKQDWPWKQ
jgi:FMN phosphatase YigB (HAD superfamily)